MNAGVCLYVIFVIGELQSPAPQPGNNALTDRMAKAIGVADCEYHIPNLCPVGISQFNGCQRGQVNLQYRQIGCRIRAYGLGSRGTAIMKQHLYRVGIGDDVVVGDDVPLIGQNHTGAQGALNALATVGGSQEAP